MNTLSRTILSLACLHPIRLVCCLPLSIGSCTELNCKTSKGVGSSIAALFTKTGSTERILLTKQHKVEHQKGLTWTFLHGVAALSQLQS